MAVGFSALKVDVDARAGQLVVTLRDNLRQIQLFKVWLDSRSDAQMIALGYTQADVDLLRASFIDLDKLRQISAAAATQPAASDFFFNAKSLVGVV